MIPSILYHKPPSAELLKPTTRDIIWGAGVGIKLIPAIPQFSNQIDVFD